jgi:2,3-bisphosphoglycerate-independent phosphoglycerate mutase
MDRDTNWDRMAKAEEVMFHAKGTVISKKASAHLDEVYTKGAKDELLEPVVIEGAHGKGSLLGPHDGVFLFNFRADRMRMLCARLQTKKDIHVVTMTEYSSEYSFPVAFFPKKIETTLAAEISKAGLTQAHIAETEKFPHATYFLNGGRNEPHQGEVHIMLESRKDIKTHDEAPEMRAEAIADKAIHEAEKGTHFIFINFANPDMVGHTANVPAIITAVEKVDHELSRVVHAVTKAGGCVVVIADHGNAEVNIDPETGTPHTSHTTSLVPCILAGDIGEGANLSLRNGGLADVAPTVLALIGVSKPAVMTGLSLLK